MLLQLAVSEWREELMYDALLLPHCQQVPAAGVPAGGNCPADHEDKGGKNLQLGEDSGREQQSQHHAAGRAVHRKDTRIPSTYNIHHL